MANVEESPSKRRRDKSLESPSKRPRVRFSEPISIPPAQSTPRRKLVYPAENLDLFDDISSIASSNGEQAPATTLHTVVSSNFSSTSSGDELEESIFDRDEIFKDYDEFFGDIGRVKVPERFKKLFKPLREKSIYNELFDNPKCAGEIAVDIMDQYEENPTEVVLKLFEFIIDVCGYQKVDIRPRCDIEKDHWIESALKYLESPECDAEVYETRQYLLGATFKTKFLVILKMAIYNFLQKLIVLAVNSRILFDPFFNKHFFRVLNVMSKSELRNIKHTASLFGAKILSTLCTVRESILNASSDYDGEDLTADNQVVEQLMFQFFVFFVRNCREIVDDRSHLILEDLTKEAAVWIHVYPKMFIGDLQCISHLMKLIKNSSKTVRIEALKLCKYLVESNNYKEHFSQDATARFLSNIEDRLLLDVSEEVTALAAESLSFFIKNEFGTIGDEKIVNIARFICLPNYKANKPCGSLWINFLSNAGYNNKQIILEVIELTRKRLNRIPTIVESLIQEFRYLTNWAFIVQAILSREIEIDKKIVLCKITHETIHQVLLGKSTIDGVQKKAHSVDDTVHVEIANNFLILAKHFLNKYRNVPDILIPLVKIVMLVDVDILPRNMAQPLQEVANAACAVFDVTGNTELMELLGNFFLHLSESCQNFLSNVKKFTEQILVQYSQKFQEALSNLNEGWSLVFKRVAILYSKFDMTDILTWEQMEVDVDTLSGNNEIIGNLLTCQYFHLVYQLRNLARKYSSPDVGRKELQLLIDHKRKCSKSFLEQSTKLMRELKGQPLHFKVFDLICKLHIEFADKLKDMCNYFKEFEVLILSLDDNKELNDLVVGFVEKYVVNNNKNLSLYERRCYIQHIINISFLATMPIGDLSCIFKYYESHKKEFGWQIEKCMTELQTHSVSTTLPLVVVHTLRQAYFDLLHKQNEIDLHSAGAKELLALAKQFVQYKMKLDNFLLFAINWASQSDAHYHFLYFARPFVDLASPQEKLEALSLVEAKLKDINHVSVTYFINALKKTAVEGKKPETAAKKKAVKTSQKTLMPPPLPITITPQKKQRKPRAKKTEGDKLAQKKLRLGVEELGKDLSNAKL